MKYLTLKGYVFLSILIIVICILWYVGETTSSLDFRVNMIAGTIGFIVGALATYFIVEDSLERRRLGKVRPISIKVLHSRLWAVARPILIILYRLKDKSDEEIKKDIEVGRVSSSVFINTFQIIERMIDIYGDRLSDEVVEKLVDFGEVVRQFADDLSHIESNFELVDELDEWKYFRKYMNGIIRMFEALANFLTKRDLLPKEFLIHYNEVKSIRYIRAQVPEDKE